MTLPILDSVRRQHMLWSLTTRCETRLERLVNDVRSDVLLGELIGILRDIGSMKAIIAQPGVDDQRSSTRIPEAAILMVQKTNGVSAQVALWDISAGGAMIELDDTMSVAVGDPMMISVPGLMNLVEASVVGASGAMVRLSFRGLGPADVVSLLKHIERHNQRY